MAKGGKRGLILDREQLCDALQITDSTVGLWEKKGMPAVRKGRGRGMKSLYSLDEVRSWCAKTGYGHTTQALLARFMRTEPPPPAVQTPAEPASPAPEEKASPWNCALELVLIAVFPLLVRLDRDQSAHLFAYLCDLAAEDLRARGVPAPAVADFLEGIPAMAQQELDAPGSWTGLGPVQTSGLPAEGDGNGPAG